MKKIILVMLLLNFIISIRFNAATVDESIIRNDQLIFEQEMAKATSGDYGIDNPYVVLDPYDRSPLSGYVGFSSNIPLSLEVVVNDKYSSEDSFVFNYGEEMKSEYFVPILGLYADYNNQITLNYTFENGTESSYDIIIETKPLPENIGTYDITYESKINVQDNGLYFDSISSGYHTGIDRNGEVRWYNSDYDVFGNKFFEILDDGRLITQNYDNDQYIVFDFNGRIYDFHTVDFSIEHDIQVLENNKILVNSEDAREKPEPTENYTIEDQISVFDLSDWSEDYTLDYKLLLNENRAPQPIPTPPNEYESDWFHANSSVYLEEENIYVTSARQQNIVIATDGDFIQQEEVEDSSGIRWILGSPQTWESEDVYDKFLTPVDEYGNALYDFSNKEELEKANSEFFSWGQHSIFPVTFDDNPATTEFLLFDDGNYSSYDANYMVSPDKNTSRMVHYKVNEGDMTVEKVDEFGTELGNDYYSSYVGNVEYHESTDSIMICFGGTNLDESIGVNVGVPIEVPMENFPNYDYAENSQFIQEKTRVVEIDRETHEILFGYDHYNSDKKGLFQNFTYKGKYQQLDPKYIYVTE